MLELEEQVRRIQPIALNGQVTRIVGQTISATGFPAPLGAIAIVEGETRLEAEVVGFSGEETLLVPYGDMSGIRRGTRVRLYSSIQRARVGEGLLGRIINGRGQFIDNLPAVVLPNHVNLQSAPISPMSRRRIDQPFSTGIRTIDGLLTCGRGQRLGIFSGSGVGKSTLLGQIARGSDADVNVVVLIGERGREVREFIDRDLGPVGLANSVIIVATGDDPAVLRLRAAHLGTAIAEFFERSGRDVMFVMDSVTRFALAQREVGLAAGELPATRGYPPSVFALLPKLLERCGRTEFGSITGFYTVLVDGDDPNEPISDAVRGILDGHFMLSRKLAEQVHFPAIDVLASVSRLMPDVTSEPHRQAAAFVRQLLSAYQQAEELILIGAYQKGSNPQVDAAIRLREPILQFLRQSVVDRETLSDTISRLSRLRNQ